VRRTPQVVQAKAKQQQVVRPSFVLIETQYYQDAHGMFWTMTVWHLHFREALAVPRD